MNEVIASIASADQLRIAAEMRRVGFMGRLHMDIEDGNFIPNITFGLKMTSAIRNAWKGHLDAHLFVTRPMEYIRPLARLGMQGIAFHIEATPYPLGNTFYQMRGHTGRHSTQPWNTA